MYPLWKLSEQSFMLYCADHPHSPCLKFQGCKGHGNVTVKLIQDFGLENMYMHYESNESTSWTVMLTRYLGRWTDIWADWWMDGWGWMDGWTDIQTDGVQHNVPPPDFIGRAQKEDDQELKNIQTDTNLLWYVISFLFFPSLLGVTW